MYIRTFVLCIILFFATASHASHYLIFAPISVTLDFESDLMNFKHAKVSATKANYKLVSLSIEIDGKLIKAGKEVLEGIKYPQLESLTIGRSAGFTFGTPASKTEVIIFLDYGECIEDANEFQCSRVQFFVDNGRFISRQRSTPFSEGSSTTYEDKF